MRNLFLGILIVFATAFVLTGLVYAIAEEKQDEVERRALGLEQKDCYSWQEVEYIIFGEVQE